MRLPPAFLLLSYLAALLLALWVSLGKVWLLLPAALSLAALWIPGGRPSSGWIARLLPLVALTIALAGTWHLHRLDTTWDARAGAAELRVREELARALDDLLLAGEAAAGGLVQAESDTLPDRRGGGLLLPNGVDALALFGPGGELMAWEGMHQGPIPREARLGLSPYLYEESALFGYLYVTRPLPDGSGTAVAASLLRSDLPAVLEETAADFTSRFRARTGSRIQVGREDRVEGDVAWALTWEREVLFSVAVVPPSKTEVLERLDARWKRVVALLLFLLWGVLARQGRSIPRGQLAAALTLPILLVVLPLGSLLGDPPLFSPVELLLPGPIPLTLGDLLLLFGAGLLLLGFRGGLPLAGVHRLAPSLRALLGGGGALILLSLLQVGASRDLLAGPEILWGLYLGVTFLSLSLLWGMLLPPLAAREPAEASSGPGTPSASWILTPLAMVLALVLGFGVAGIVWVRGEVPLGLGLLWILPLLLLLRAGPLGPRWQNHLFRWMGVGVLAGSLVLPLGWESRVEAQRQEAESRIQRLGSRPDPFLEFLLLRTGEEARALSLTGRDPVEVLYGAWTRSGLAREGVPIWLTWWSAEGFPQEELRIGVATPRPGIPSEIRLMALTSGEVELRRLDQAEAHYLIAAPLALGATLTATVPPRRGFGGSSPLGPLFTPARLDRDPVVLIPLARDEPFLAEGASDTVRWVRTAEGWLGEQRIPFPDQDYRVRYDIPLPGPLLLLARGVLLLFAFVALLTALAGLGRRIADPEAIPLRRLLEILASFRGRVTLTLFVFFLLPTLIFGTLAYQTLAGASVRTAEALAGRAAEEAAAGFEESGGGLDLLASRVGSDLLLYEGGQLVGGSQRELVELGLYPGWIPPEVERDLTLGSTLLTTTTASLGGWRYVVAYRRISGGLVVAAPAALQAGATAVRQREVADLLLFALVLGGGLSILLALLVGRALSLPIQTLQIASERVGSGNMGVHLPTGRTDEFGAVFEAFNRMVDRLARTRRALVRNSRRTRAIVEQVATGVVAVDRQGRVILANPRAEALLEIPIPPRLPLASEGPAEPVAAWLTAFLGEERVEDGAEFTLGGRRLRLRARQIQGAVDGTPAGAVLALEDVTDELRTERILAWGEMAQQVAHEVKNPLTPIKLGVQHLVRAWRDERSDYGEILERNAEAILGEIDRLAGIATSFARFGAPAPAGDSQLSPLSLADLTGEVMALYNAGEGSLTVRAQIDPSLPKIRGRADEFKEVLVNLLENARAALPEGGEVQILGAEEEQGGWIRMEVRDRGAGIPKALLPKIFEPHFSTRTRGAGLGLAIVQRLVESWGGEVGVESEAGLGTTVFLRLPPAEVSESGGASGSTSP